MREIWTHNRKLFNNSILHQKKNQRNMFTLEQKIWIVQKCSSEHSHAVVRRISKKKFDIKGRQTKLFAEKRFSKVHNHFLNFGTVTGQRSKKVSPVMRNLKESLKSCIDSNPVSLSKK